VSEAREQIGHGQSIPVNGRIVPLPLTLSLTLALALALALTLALALPLALALTNAVHRELGIERT
jgi:hypothetical protein